MKPLVNLYKLGRLPYVKALDVQRALFDKLKASVVSVGPGDGTNSPAYPSANAGSIYSKHHRPSPNWRSPKENTRKNSLILVEHEPVYTIGIRSKLYNDDYVVKLKDELSKRNLSADLIKTNRGGLITFHGPGQLIAYPIIFLGDFKNTIHNRSVKAYVNALEATIIDTLAALGLEGAHTVQEYPGVWLDGGERKIAFIGISCKRYVTMHGISINCNCDLSWFDHIVSCGIEDKSITSIERELLITGIEPKLNKSNHRFLSLDTRGELEIQRDQSLKLPDSDEKLNHIRENSKCPESSVEQVSSAFCRAFSHHFDCNLIETEYPQ